MLECAPEVAIIVLTGGQARLDAALELLKSGKGGRLLISGVHPSADLGQQLIGVLEAALADPQRGESGHRALGGCPSPA